MRIKPLRIEPIRIKPKAVREVGELWEAWEVGWGGEESFPSDLINADTNWNRTRERERYEIHRWFPRPQFEFQTGHPTFKKKITENNGSQIRWNDWEEKKDEEEEEFRALFSGKMSWHSSKERGEALEGRCVPKAGDEFFNSESCIALLYLLFLLLLLLLLHLLHLLHLFHLSWRAQKDSFHTDWAWKKRHHSATIPPPSSGHNSVGVRIHIGANHNRRFRRIQSGRLRMLDHKKGKDIAGHWCRPHQLNSKKCK